MKMILFIIIGLVVLVILGVVYFMALRASTPTETTQIQTPTTAPSPSPTQIPSPTIGATEENVENIDVPDPSQDLNTINQEVNQL